jgi:hypothetical protein
MHVTDHYESIVEYGCIRPQARVRSPIPKLDADAVNALLAAQAIVTYALPQP